MSAATVRDRYGIPHVTATSVLDLAREQGRVTAHDRGWQLEYARRRATGTTAALLGAGGLPWDLFARRAGLEGLGRRALAGLDAETRSFLASYVDGVNEGLVSADRPAELEALEAAAQPWEPWVPLAVFAAHHMLFASFPTKLWRHHLRARVAPEVARVFHDEGLWVPGSNAWVVGGGRTASGLPMVGGDPHRSFESPNGYQQVRLTCTDPDDGFDVAGFTFPGVPGVQHFAHAGAVAWGITNAMGDYQDLYVERLRRTGTAVEAAAPGGWEPCERATATVEVRDADPVEVEVLVTGNGPVVLGGPDDAEALSLRTPSLVLGDLGFGALLPLLRARSVADVTAALGSWVEPVNNLLVADVHGTVEQRVVGRVPLRPEENRWRPVPGWEPEHRWTGWVDDLPGRDVPADGHLATANHRLDETFDAIGVEFAPPGRGTRIDALLEGRSGLVAEDFATIHGDTLAGQPAALLAAVLALPAPDLPAGAARVQGLLARWDQRFEPDSAAAAAYVAVREALVARLATAPPFDGLAGADPYGPLYAGWFHVPTQLYLSLANLTSPEGRAVVPDLDAHLAAALDDVAALEPGEWGARHRFRPFHVLGASYGFALPAEPPVGGDNDCVRCTGSVPGTDVAFRGSVARYVWDLAGLDRSGWVVPLGASGDPASPHHHDQLDAWLDARLLPLC